MVRMIKKVLIIANLHKIEAAELIEEIKQYMSERGIATEVFGFKGHKLGDSAEEARAALAAEPGETGEAAGDD